MPLIIARPAKSPFGLLYDYISYYVACDCAKRLCIAWSAVFFIIDVVFILFPEYDSTSDFFIISFFLWTAVPGRTRYFCCTPVVTISGSSYAS